jgi:hypothetical protein
VQGFEGGRAKYQLLNMASYRAPRMWLAAVVAGVIVALLSLWVFPHPSSTAWPPTAAAILPTLLVALAVIVRLYPDPARVRLGDPFSILALSGTFVAEIIAVADAAAGRALDVGLVAVVNGAIACMTAAVVSIPLVDPTPRETGATEHLPPPGGSSRA